MYIFIFVTVLLLISALYVAAEFASVAVKKVRIEYLAERGDIFARRLLPYIEDINSLDRYVATCQIGITVCSLALGILGEKSITPYLRYFIVSIWGENIWGVDSDVWGPILGFGVVLLCTALQLVAGELIPKAIAVRYTEKVALFLTFPMIWSLHIFSLFIDVLNGSSDTLLRFLGVKLETQRHVHSPEELSSLVEHSDDIDEKEQKRIERVLHFGDRSARDIMIPRNRMYCIDIETPRQEILEMVVNSPYTRFPVYKDSEDKIIGILHLKDLLSADLHKRGENSDSQSISALKKMLRPVVFCPSSLGLDKVLEKLSQSRAYMAVLEDEYGGTAGILTIEDILEEVLGEINDEFDSDTKFGDEEIKELHPGDYVVCGTVLIDDLAELHGIDLTTQDIHAREVRTLGGLVMHLNGDTPKVGLTVESDLYKLTVVSMRERQVLRVRVTRKEDKC